MIISGNKKVKFNSLVSIGEQGFFVHLNCKHHSEIFFFKKVFDPNCNGFIWSEILTMDIWLETTLYYQKNKQTKQDKQNQDIL